MQFITSIPGTEMTYNINTKLSAVAMIDQVIRDIRIQNNELADALVGMADNFAYVNTDFN